MICPLCQFEFNDRNACVACGLASRCPMIRCPHCHYEFVEDSRIVSFFGKLRQHFSSDSGPMPLTEGRAGGCYRVLSLNLGRPLTLERLLALGIVPGSRLELQQKRPSFVLKSGETTLAVDSEVAAAILVEPFRDPTR